MGPSVACWSAREPRPRLLQQCSRELGWEREARSRLKARAPAPVHDQLPLRRCSISLSSSYHVATCPRPRVPGDPISSSSVAQARTASRRERGHPRGVSSRRPCRAVRLLAAHAVTFDFAHPSRPPRCASHREKLPATFKLTGRVLLAAVRQSSTLARSVPDPRGAALCGRILVLWRCRLLGALLLTRAGGALPGAAARRDDVELLRGATPRRSGRSMQHVRGDHNDLRALAISRASRSRR